jgi:4-hydroxybenzoate polyprenyltransferase
VSTLAAMITLSRPRGMILVAILPMVGFSYAYWDHGCEAPGFTAVPRLLLLGLVWAVPHAGTMWLNAALDRDEEATLFGRSVAVPAGIERWAYLTLALSIGLALWLSLGLAVCVVGCAALSILYSHPRTAWKGHAILGPMTNALGYGVLSPLGGFLFAGYAPTIRGGFVLIIAVFWMLTAYFAAQAFQQGEDRARGYRTLVATHGPVTTLRLTRALLLTSLGLTALMSASGMFPRIMLAPLPLFFFLDRYMVRWTAQPDGGDARWAANFFIRLTALVLLVLVFVSVDYELTKRSRSLPGGLATESGLFEPRACEAMWPAFVDESRSR